VMAVVAAVTAQRRCCYVHGRSMQYLLFIHDGCDCLL
jgi:hypothetical protein